AARLAAHQLDSVLLPPLPYTAAPFGAAFAGTLSVSPVTVTALIVDVARELARQGFAALAIANAHLDPTHLGSLAEAVTRIDAGGLIAVACPDLTKRALAERLTEEFQSGACHAGRYETSIVLAERPAAVRESVRTTLPPNPASLSSAIRAGRVTFEQAGGARAYFGWPADATAEEGRETLTTLGAILAESVIAALEQRRRS